jgi:hypothetical protein
VKDILALLGILFLALLGMAILAGFNTMTGGQITVMVDGTPLGPENWSLPDLGSLDIGGPGPNTANPGAVSTQVIGGSGPQWTNPLDGQPLPELFPTATTVPTAVPPLDPTVYRSEVTVRLKSFAAALESFLATNDRLALNNALLDDPAWRSEMRATLDQVSAAGQALDVSAPPPLEYAQIHAHLEQVGPNAQSLRDRYLQAMDTRDPQDFTMAGEHYQRIKETLTQALGEMIKAGWPVE